MNDKRGSGRTTKQMQDAPRDAFYIIERYTELWYATGLAAALERDDLRIWSRAQFFSRRAWQGQRRHVVVDHACALTPEQQEILHIIAERLKQS